MGRPRRLTGQRSRMVSLDAETYDEADRVGNFSAWVRGHLRARLNGSEAVHLDDVPTRRLAAIILDRVGRMEREAGDDEDAQPVDELKAVRDAILEWFQI